MALYNGSIGKGFKINMNALKWLGARVIFIPTLAWNVLLGKVLRIRHWWDFIDDQVIVGAFPFWFDVAAMAEDGVQAVVNTCNEYGGPVKQYDQFGIEQLRVPTIDFTAPSLDSIQRGVEFIQQHVEQDHNVYVHCKAGRGRSATIALCWLMAHRDMTPDQAQAYLLSKRPHVHSTLPARTVVKEYWGMLQAREEQGAIED